MTGPNRLDVEPPRSRLDWFVPWVGVLAAAALDELFLSGDVRQGLGFLAMKLAEGAANVKG